MALDNDKLAAFAGILISALRAEIGEANQRAERMREAVRHAGVSRDRARAAIEASSDRRQAREDRLWKFDDDGAA
jgi:hypothetical protein